MGIQPIDLQTLYAQMEKVGKQRSAEQKAQQNAIEQQQEAAKIETEKKQHSVQETKEYNSGEMAINEDGRGNDTIKNKSKKKEKRDNIENHGMQSTDYITDPALGRRVDFSK